MTADLFLRRQAEISECGRFRWRMERRWGQGGTVCWIMANPSKADGRRDDPTTHAVMRFTRGWGYGGAVVVNLCPLITPHPDKAAAWLLTPEASRIQMGNNLRILSAAWASDLVIAAWGAHPGFADEARGKLALLEVAGIRLHHLGLTAGGHPKHPLARGRHRIHREQEPLPWAA